MPISESLRKLIKNTSYLTAIQATNYLFPILLTSFLIRTVGPDIFGRISYIQNFTLYLLVFLNFGFDFMITKEISLRRDNLEKLSETVWASLYLKALLLIGTAAIVAVVFAFSPRFHSDPQLYFGTSLILAGYALFPNWYFQGVEKMKVTSMLNFLIKLLPFMTIFLMVKTPVDYMVVPLSNSIFQIVVGLLSLFLCLRDFRFSKEPYRKIKHRMIELAHRCVPIFFSTLVQSWHSLGNFIVLGWFVSESMLGYYSVVQRTVLAALILTQLPFNYAFYPHFIRAIETSRERAIILFQKVFYITLLAGLLLSVTLYACAPFIILILMGSKNPDSISALRILSFLPIFWGITCITNFQGLYAFGYERYSPIVSTASAVISLLVTISLAPSFGILGACWGWICGQAAEVVQGIFILHKKGIKLHPIIILNQN